MKNRMREFRSSGSARDGAGNVPIYSALIPKKRILQRVAVDLLFLADTVFSTALAGLRLVCSSHAVATAETIELVGLVLVARPMKRMIFERMLVASPYKAAK